MQSTTRHDMALRDSQGDRIRLSHALEYLQDADERMSELIEKGGTFTLRPNPDAWGVLVGAVVHQQISGKAAASICSKLEALGSDKVPRPHEVRALSSEKLRALGLPRRKIKAIKEFGKAVEDGDLCLDRLAASPDPRIRDTLVEFHGVGPWTAKMWMIFHAGRVDVMLPGDLGLRRAMKSEYTPDEVPSKTEAADLAEQWSPYRTIASWYLWRSLPDFPEPGIAISEPEQAGH